MFILPAILEINLCWTCLFESEFNVLLKSYSNPFLSDHIHRNDQCSRESCGRKHDWSMNASYKLVFFHLIIKIMQTRHHCSQIISLSVWISYSEDSDLVFSVVLIMLANLWFLEVLINDATSNWIWAFSRRFVSIFDNYSMVFRTRHILE